MKLNKMFDPSEVKRTIASAIQRSQDHDAIVTLECLSSDTADFIRDALRGTCKGCCEDAGPGLSEYWGRDDIDRLEWRVHVRARTQGALNLDVINDTAEGD